VGTAWQLRGIGTAASPCRGFSYRRDWGLSHLRCRNHKHEYSKRNKKQRAQSASVPQRIEFSVEGSSRRAELTGFEGLPDLLGDQVAHARGGDGSLASRQFRRANAALEDSFDGRLDRFGYSFHAEGVAKH